MRSYALMPNFGRISTSTGEDSSKHKVELEDQAIRVDSDNGYVFTRPRHTRKARKSFETGFTDLSETNRKELVKFYEARMGGVEPFFYKSPVSGDLHLVRFADKLLFSYKGIGGVHLWDVLIKLTEV